MGGLWVRRPPAIGFTHFLPWERPKPPPVHPLRPILKGFGPIFGVLSHFIGESWPEIRGSRLTNPPRIAARTHPVILRSIYL